jgi:glycosyltransferase involved in cell wall biosynthesis
MKNVSLVIITDGRLEYLEKTMNSLYNNVKYPFVEKIIVNDCIDIRFRNKVKELADIYSFFTINHNTKMGFARVYNTAWKRIWPSSDFVFSTEDDFTFNEEIDVEKMIEILEYDRNLVQVALKRQAWNEEEKKAGGIVELWPDQYEEKNVGDLSWTEHRQFFTTNPSLISKWVIDRGWPLVPDSEGIFTHELFKNPNYKSCFYGGKFDKPKVEHIGITRAGINY